MKRLMIAPIAYLTAGIGCYYTFFGGAGIYGMIIFSLGLLGVLYDVFYTKLNVE
jgi:hypothetical protein